MIYFETQRLIFRDWTQQDLLPFQIMNQDPKVMEYFQRTLSNDESKAFYDRIQDEFKEFGYGLYAVETRHDGKFIGFIGFHRATFVADFTPCVEIGWRLQHDAWGHGYATEGAMACLEYGIQKLNLDQVVSFAPKSNFRSQNVMRKIGLKKVKEFNHPALDEKSPISEHVLYSLTG